MPTESFFSSASLAFLPSGGAGKDTKAYSIKPTDGSGDFTFSRGSNLAATRVGPTGLIEKGRENLFKHSNDFNQSVWIQSGTITSGQSGYDGTNNAWKFENPSPTSSMYQSNTNSGVQTISAYFKKNATYGVRFFAFGSSNANTFFDLNNGVVVAQNNTIDASVEPVGTDWFRCSMTINQTNSRCDFYVTNNAQIQVLGHITIQDAQLEIGLAATDYIESGATTGKAGLLEDEPRFDYSGGATCPSLLLEPSRTQLVKYSELINPTISGLSWQQVNTNTFTNNYGIAPDGTQTSTLVQFASANSSSQLFYLINFSASVYTTSIWAKGSGSFKLGFFDNTNVLTDTITLSSEWQRFDVTKTTLAASGGRGAWLYPNADGDTIEIWGAQVEEGYYPTSYIPNHSGGSVTRESDGLDLNPLDQSYGSESTWFFEAERLPSDDLLNQTLGIFTNSGAVGAVNRFVVNSTGNGRLRVSVYDENGISENLFSNTDVFVKGQTTKFALKIAAGNIALFINGNDPITETGLGVITGIDRVVTIEDTILKQFLVFPEALSNEDCKNLTTL